MIAGAAQGDAATVEAAAAVAAALGGKARLALFPPEANSLGLALLGDGTGAAGSGLEAAVAALEAGHARHAIVLENDLFERADAALVERLLAAAGTVVVLDAIETRTTGRAGIVLPVASFAEAAGTLVNHEGRAQRFFSAVAGGPPAAWRRLQALADAPFGWQRLDDVLAALADAAPVLAEAKNAAPEQAFRTPLGAVARASRAYSGRTASDIAGRVAAGAAEDPDSPLAFTMEGAHGAQAPSALITGYEVPGLHSASASYRFHDVPDGALVGGDPGVRLLDGGTVALSPPAETEKEAEAGDPTEGSTAQGEGFVRILTHDPFTGDETARASAPLSERAPPPRLAIHPDDAAALGVSDGTLVRVEGTAAAPLPVSLDAALPRGHAALSAGGIAPRGGVRRVRIAPTDRSDAGR